MGTAIQDIDPQTGASRGSLCVDPSGHIVTVPATAPINAGRRLATPGDLEKPAPAAAVIERPAPSVDEFDLSDRD